MSTVIDVYPTTDTFPLVAQTCARAEELFEELFDRHGIWTDVKVKAFYPSKEGEVRYVEKDVVWEPGLYLGFAYWVDGEWESSSFPCCRSVEEDDLVTEEDLGDPLDPDPEDFRPEHLGVWYIVGEFEGVLPDEKLKKVLAQNHYWSDERRFGGNAFATVGYGFVAAALAEATDGVIASFDRAFEPKHNGESAEEFLSWWGDFHIDFYGIDRFD